VALTLGVKGAVRALLTVTVDEGDEVTDSGEDAPSVISSSKAYVEPTVRVLAEMLQVSVAPVEAPAPLLNAHWVDGA
jgi:hypothetical protein